jgi:hypothetical protein
MRIRLVALFAVLLAAGLSARAADSVKTFGIVLFQPDSVLQERVPSLDAMIDYIRAVEQAIQSAVSASDKGSPTAGFVVVAVRPGRKSNVWFDFDPPFSPDVRTAVAARARAVLPFLARDGPVVFAIKVGLWGGVEPKRAVPSPAEWKAAAMKAGRPIETGELVEMIWVD